jgi:hypothetical protein
MRLCSSQLTFENKWRAKTVNKPQDASLGTQPPSTAQRRPTRALMRDKVARKSLNRLLDTLAPLVNACLNQQTRRDKAATLRQARALRTVPPGRQVARSVAEIELAKVAPIGRAVVAAAYDVPIGRPLEELQPSWDDWDRWTYGGYDGSFTGMQFAKARDGSLKRQVWDCFRRGMTTDEIARTVRYTLEYLDPREIPEENPTLYASPQWVQQVLDAGIAIVKQRNGIQQ